MAMKIEMFCIPISVSGTQFTEVLRHYNIEEDNSMVDPTPKQ